MTLRKSLDVPRWIIFRGCFSTPSFAGVSISSFARFAEGSSTNFTSATEVSRVVLGMMRHDRKVH